MPSHSLDAGTAAVNKQADILIAIGATGSGKSTRCKRDIQQRGLERLMVWDWMREYDKLPVAKTLAGLHAGVSGSQHFAVRFLPSYDQATRLQQFDTFCAIAMATGKLALLCEELSKVVRSNGSSEGWERIITEGRHRELIVYGTSQRPALIDKTSLSQATRLYCGNLELREDVQRMSAQLGVSADEIQALAPWDYIERHRETKAMFRGNLANGVPNVAQKLQKSEQKETKQTKTLAKPTRKTQEITANPGIRQRKKPA